MSDRQLMAKSMQVGVAELSKLASRFERERDESRAEVERLSGWLRKIKGGDTPCTDESQLRQWAYEALTLGRLP